MEVAAAQSRKSQTKRKLRVSLEEINRKNEIQSSELQKFSLKHRLIILNKYP
jgi:hypothetical protein